MGVEFHVKFGCWRSNKHDECSIWCAPMVLIVLERLLSLPFLFVFALIGAAYGCSGPGSSISPSFFICCRSRPLIRCFVWPFLGRKFCHVLLMILGCWIRVRFVEPEPPANPTCPWIQSWFLGGVGLPQTNRLNIVSLQTRVFIFVASDKALRVAISYTLIGSAKCVRPDDSLVSDYTLHVYTKPVWVSNHWIKLSGRSTQWHRPNICLLCIRQRFREV